MPERDFYYIHQLKTEVRAYSVANLDSCCINNIKDELTRTTNNPIDTNHEPPDTKHDNGVIHGISSNWQIDRK